MFYAAYLDRVNSGTTFKERFVGNFNLLYSAKKSIQDTGGEIYRFFSNGCRDFRFEKLVLKGE